MSLNDSLLARVDERLPQTQCTQCGYPRCLDYADAIVEGQSDINRCPPGGEVTLTALTQLTKKTYKPLDAELRPYPGRLTAYIREAECIGCVLCIKACPVDVIVGAAKLMHTVITAECTGCELCIEPCPMDCIDLVPVENSVAGIWPQFSDEEVKRFRLRTQQYFNRIENTKQDTKANQQPKTSMDIDRRQIIKEAVARVRARRNASV